MHTYASILYRYINTFDVKLKKRKKKVTVGIYHMQHNAYECSYIYFLIHLCYGECVRVPAVTRFPCTHHKTIHIPTYIYIYNINCCTRLYTYLPMSIYIYICIYKIYLAPIMIKGCKLFRADWIKSKNYPSYRIRYKIICGEDLI